MESYWNRNESHSMYFAKKVNYGSTQESYDFLFNKHYRIVALTGRVLLCVRGKLHDKVYLIRNLTIASEIRQKSFDPSPIRLHNVPFTSG